MKRKKELIILAIITLALVLYLTFRNQNRTQYQLPEIPQISKFDITKIEILKKGSSLVLARKDNAWYVSPQEYPLDKTKMDSMLDVIDDLILDGLVSESKSYFRYDLDDEKTVRIQHPPGLYHSSICFRMELQSQTIWFHQAARRGAL